MEVTPEVLETIDRVCKRLSHKFKFGYHSPEDMKQEATIIALEKLHKWDGVRPLENFLYRCVYNGLFNFKRDNYQRPDKPCLTCPLYQVGVGSECAKYDDKMECEPYSKWFNKNSNKKNIIQPIDITNIRDEQEENMRADDEGDTAENKELWALIDKHLDITLRADYIKMRNGVKIPKNKRTKVEQAILEIVKERYDE